MRIIAIDPGFERVGIAIIEKMAREKETVVHSECFKTSATLPLAERLALIGDKIKTSIGEHTPGALAVESLFFTKNQTSGIAVAEARGVILAEAARQGLRVYEYTPNQIKLAVTGHGGADKKQVMYMVEKLVHLPKKIISDDEMDAVATGLTCFAIERF